MKTCVYFTILCILLELYVQQSHSSKNKYPHETLVQEPSNGHKEEMLQAIASGSSVKSGQEQVFDITNHYKQNPQHEAQLEDQTNRGQRLLHESFGGVSNVEQEQPTVDDYGSQSQIKDSDYPLAQIQDTGHQNSTNQSGQEPGVDVVEISQEQHTIEEDQSSIQEFRGNVAPVDPRESSSQEQTGGLQAAMNDTLQEPAEQEQQTVVNYDSQSQIKDSDYPLSQIQATGHQNSIHQTGQEPGVDVSEIRQELHTTEEDQSSPPQLTIQEYPYGGPIESSSQEQAGKLQTAMNDTIQEPGVKVPTAIQENQGNANGYQSPPYESESQDQTEPVQETLQEPDVKTPNAGQTSPEHNNYEDQIEIAPQEMNNGPEQPTNEIILEPIAKVSNELQAQEQETENDYLAPLPYLSQPQHKNSQDSPSEPDRLQKIFDYSNRGPTLITSSVTHDIDILNDRSQCPLGYQGLWANPKDCSKFINCAEPQSPPPASNLDSFCHHKDSGIYDHPNDCSKFLICDSGRTHELQCDGGTYFNGLWSTCDHAANVVCNKQAVRVAEQSRARSLLSGQTHNIKCPMDVFGVFPYPFDNGHYIKCIDGRLLIKPCRRGTMFSLSRKLCDIPTYLESNDTAVPDIQKLPDSEQNNGDLQLMNSTVLKCPPAVMSGRFVYPFLNTRYIKCLNGVMMVKTCPPGKVYIIRDKRCMLRDQADVEDFVQGVENSFKTISNDHRLGVLCGPQSNGRYAHPEDMRKVVICRNGVVTIEQLPDGQIFDLSSTAFKDIPSGNSDCGIHNIEKQKLPNSSVPSGTIEQKLSNLHGKVKQIEEKIANQYRKLRNFLAERYGTLKSISRSLWKGPEIVYTFPVNSDEDLDEYYSCETASWRKMDCRQ